MKSIKPGRGPSMLSAFGSIVMAIIGIGWTAFAMSMGAPGIVPLFGVCFIVIAIVGGIYNFKNATSKNRYSAFDITDNDEEPDPFNQKFGNLENRNSTTKKSVYCPYCGAKTKADYTYCRECGKKIY